MQEFHHAHDLIATHAGAAASLRATHAMILPGAAPDWIQLLPLGSFSGRDGRGPYRLDDQSAAQKVIAATLALAAGAELPIDYDHQSDFAAVPGVGGTAPAAGWIKELQARPDGIWARVEWTEAGATKLKAKEYRYISPVFTHTKSGEVALLLRAGLTNNPNLELKAVASAQPHEDDMDFIAKLRKALGLPETASEAEVLAHAARVQLHSASFVALASAAAVKLDDKVETIAVAADMIGGKIKGYDEAAQAAGLKPEDKPEQLVTAINSLSTGAVDPAKYVPAAEVAALQTQLNDLKKAVNSGKAVADVDAAIQAGKLVPALRDWGLSLHAKDPQEFAAYVAGAPVVLKPGTTEPLAQHGAGADGLTADERAVCTAMGISAEDFKKNKDKEA